MKERKTLIDKAKQLYLQHENKIQIAIIIIVAITLFIGGYLVSWKKPLDDSRFELYEQIARDVYAQKKAVIVEAPEDVSISITTTTITVQSADNRYRGKLIAKLQNGELIMSRNLENGTAIFMSILVGIVFVFGTSFIVSVAYVIYKIVKKK